jgi:DNA-binding IclR family transcriptional regulator
MRLLGLFDALAKSPKDGLGLAELNTVLNSPKSSLLNLLRPLVSGRYRLGPSIFRLAGTIMSIWNFSNTVRPFLEELAVRSRESVYLGALDRLAISAPVFGADGMIAPAIAVGGPTDRLQPRITELRPIIADIAARASGRGGMESHVDAANASWKNARRGLPGARECCHELIRVAR